MSATARGEPGQGQVRTHPGLLTWMSEPSVRESSFVPPRVLASHLFPFEIRAHLLSPHAPIRDTRLSFLDCWHLLKIFGTNRV